MNAVVPFPEARAVRQPPAVDPLANERNVAVRDSVLKHCKLHGLSPKDQRAAVGHALAQIKDGLSACHAIAEGKRMVDQLHAIAVDAAFGDDIR